MRDRTRAAMLADAVMAQRGVTTTWPPPPPKGWEHLPVSLVDTTFSLQARYRKGEVFRPVQRYADWAAERLRIPTRLLLAGIRTDRLPEHEHSLSEMVGLLEPLSGEERVDVFGNRRPASTRAGAPRRADTVVEAAQVLAKLGIETRHDFMGQYADPDRRRDLRAAWFRVPGFGQRSWEYIPMLCGLPGVKTDVHVTLFVGEALDSTVTPEEARDLVFAATEELRRRDPGRRWEPGGVEHLMWRAASGQPPL